MPGYKKHIAAGIGSYVALIACLSIRSISLLRAAEWLFFMLLGSLFPDIDIKSKGQLLFYHIGLLILLFCMLFSQWRTVGIMSISLCLPLLVRHRGIFHNFWLISGITLSAVFYAASLWPRAQYSLFSDAFFFLAGVASHLILDKGVRKTFLSL